MSSGYIILYRNRETKEVLITTAGDFGDVYVDDESTQLLFCQYVGDFKAAQREIDDTIDLWRDPKVNDQYQLMYIIDTVQNIANDHPPTTLRPHHA